MCLPVSRLFWVSSLAYPNLLGTKGYVVVVVEDQPQSMGSLSTNTCCLMCLLANNYLNSLPGPEATLDSITPAYQNRITNLPELN
jgi:hypothetical protein